MKWMYLIAVFFAYPVACAGRAHGVWGEGEFHQHRCILPQQLPVWADFGVQLCVHPAMASSSALTPIADRNRDFRHATLCLGPCCVQHASSQDAKLELADTALRAEQQAIVRTAWIVDAVKIDDARLDQPAQLKQMVPISPISGEPGGIEAQHRSNIRIVFRPRARPKSPKHEQSAQ
jgi:hypothetical protein